jgi:site-specific recombinase XerC
MRDPSWGAHIQKNPVKLARPRAPKAYQTESAKALSDNHLERLRAVIQTRHTFARIVAESSGSIVETQDALGHRNPATTRVYVQRIAVKHDKLGKEVAKRLKL